MTSKLFFKNCVEVNGDVVLDICKTIKELEKTSVFFERLLLFLADSGRLHLLLL